MSDNAVDRMVVNLSVSSVFWKYLVEGKLFVKIILLAIFIEIAIWVLQSNCELAHLADRSLHFFRTGLICISFPLIQRPQSDKHFEVRIICRFAHLKLIQSNQ